MPFLSEISGIFVWTVYPSYIFFNLEIAVCYKEMKEKLQLKLIVVLQKKLAFLMLLLLQVDVSFHQACDDKG